MECHRSIKITPVGLDVLGLCTSRTDKACLNSKCFIGEAKELRLKSLYHQPLKAGFH